MSDLIRSIEKQIKEKNENPKTREQIIIMIENANTKEELNKLRVYATCLTDRDILSLWQKKYRTASMCHYCQRSL